MDLALDLDKMNAELSPILQSSSFSSTYLYNMMGIDGPSVYEWRKDVGWRKLEHSNEP